MIGLGHKRSEWPVSDNVNDMSANITMLSVQTGDSTLRSFIQHSTTLDVVQIRG